MGPYKCPECHTWWAGTTHQCSLHLVDSEYSAVIPISLTEGEFRDWVAYCREHNIEDFILEIKRAMWEKAHS